MIQSLAALGMIVLVAAILCVVGVYLYDWRGHGKSKAFGFDGREDS